MTDWEWGYVSMKFKKYSSFFLFNNVKLLFYLPCILPLFTKNVKHFRSLRQGFHDSNLYICLASMQNIFKIHSSHCLANTCEVYGPLYQSISPNLYHLSNLTFTIILICLIVFVFLLLMFNC